MKQTRNRGADHNVLSVWREQVALAMRHPSLRQQLVYRQSEILPRFAEQYQRLVALGRPIRRRLQRRWKQSVAGLALLSALGMQPGLAATINVGGTCTLIKAIVSANINASPGRSCTPGRGADSIVLRRGSRQILRSVSNPTYGPTGLPTIRGAITIIGNGSTIQRARNAPAFRIFSVAKTGDLRLVNTTVTGGRADIDGGGVLNLGSLTITNSRISGNAADYDGGGVSNYGTATISGGSISGNRGSRFGGGVSNSSAATVTITSSTISRNAAELFGGGVSNGGGTLTINNSTISGNDSSARAGVSNSGIATITNSTISGNAADYVGGGVSNFETATITNSTISDNSAGDFAGGVFNRISGNLTLVRNLIVGNAAASGAEIGNDQFGTGGIINAANFNIVGHQGRTNAQAFVNFVPGATDITATSNGNTPTALAAILNTTLANNGGIRSTHALVSGSPAIDAVTDGTCPPPARDQRGIARPRDGDGDGGVACDIGAFELRLPNQ